MKLIQLLFFKENNKAVLLQIVRDRRNGLVQYKIDSMAAENGHKVIRLPPYHCVYNPIELIWAQIKGFVADKNFKHTMTEVENLTKEAIKNISCEKWTNCIDHCWKLIQESQRADDFVEVVVEDMIIENPNAESTDEGSEIDDNVEPESSEFYSSSESDSEEDLEERY